MKDVAYHGPSDAFDDELRTPEPDYLGGRTYAVRPEAHAKLRDYCRARRRHPIEDRPRRPSADVVTNLSKAIRKRNEILMATKLSDEEIRRAHHLYTNGVTIEDLADRFEVSPDAIKRRFRKLNLSMGQALERDLEQQTISQLRGELSHLHQRQSSWKAAETHTPCKNGIYPVLVRNGGYIYTISPWCDGRWSIAPAYWLDVPLPPAPR